MLFLLAKRNNIPGRIRWNPWNELAQLNPLTCKHLDEACLSVRLDGDNCFFNKECIGWTKTVCHAGQHNTFQYLWKQTISTTCGGWRNKKCHSCDVKAIGHALRRKETSVRSNDTLIKPINWFFWRMNPIIQKHVHYLVHIQGDVLSWRSAMKLFPTNSSSRRTKKGV